MTQLLLLQQFTHHACRRTTSSCSCYLLRFSRSGSLRWLSSTSSSSSSSSSSDSDIGSSTIRSSSNNNNNRIVIVGGGPTGLFMANLLSIYGINNYILLDRTLPSQRFQHPQAHFLNTRSMEILKHATLSQSPNNIYNKIINAMPPINEWNHFHFGPTMMTSTTTNSTMMARVKHPVDRPLLSKNDSNGILVVEKESESEERQMMIEKEDDQQSNNNRGMELSDCSVGHLAQHTFSRILYEEVFEKLSIISSAINTTTSSCDDDNDDDDSSSSQKKPQLRYGTNVNNCYFDKTTNEWVLSISDVTEEEDNNKDKNAEEIIRASTIVVADGAKSSIRQILQIPMIGQHTIQNLINVHFTLREDNDNNIPPAMLYSIFNSKILAMIVRHSSTEYVMQIPYFPPYQTLEEDFTYDQVKEMIIAALGGGDHDNNNNNPSLPDFEIKSIRPWTMGSLVAQNYYYHVEDNGDNNNNNNNNNNGIFLVGDAAHVFPPAGGFGMNTGLQDVYALAWRLAIQSSSHNKRDINNNIGQIYQSERQPIAQQNAALSVRNYRRVLQVMEACYLHHQHPNALIAGLDIASTFMMPLKTRQNTFRSLLQTAMWPLNQLQTSPNGPYARHVTNNLRTLLKAGQGLPLLFPNHEIGFQYNNHKNDDSTGLSKNGNNSSSSSSNNKNDDFTTDTIADNPKLAEGYLFPHLSAKVVSTINQNEFPNLCYLDNCGHHITTRDLAAQVIMPIQQQQNYNSNVAFCLLYITNRGNNNNASAEGLLADIELSNLCERISESIGISCQAATMEVVVDMNDDIIGYNSNDSMKADNTTRCSPILKLKVDKKQWDSLDLDSSLIRRNDEGDPIVSFVVVIRPDGHVASVVNVPEERENEDSGVVLLENMLIPDVKASIGIE